MPPVTPTASQYPAPLRNKGRSRSPRICLAVLSILPGVPLEIIDVRLRAQLGEQFRGTIGARQARNFAIGIIQVAEDHGLGRAGLNAGGIEPAILEVAFFALGLNLRGADALHAEGAFFHDAHAAHGDIGIQLQMKRLLPLRIEKIQEAHSIRAGVGAEARADAAVIDLRVQAFGRVITGKSGADGLAGRIVALLAKDGLEAKARVGKFAFPIALHANPVLGSAAGGLVGASGADIIFGMTGDHAGFAAGAAVKVDDHGPFVSHFVQRRSSSAGKRLIPPAKTISLPCSAPPTGASLTRVAAQASAPVSRSVSGARMESGFAPRPLA